MGTIAYNDTDYDCSYIYTATSGGTVFSANLKDSTAFDLFPDTPTADDAIYFSRRTPNISDIKVNVGTALAGTDVVLIWEHWSNGWKTIPRLNDETVGFTKTGTNTVKFPIPPVQQYSTTVNGVNTFWIRCRLVSFTAVTEGGATTTDKVKTHDGLVTVTDYTEGSPCTFDLIYDYLNTDYPEVGATKNGKSFCFNHCSLTISSYMTSNDETVYLGNGGRTLYDFDYLQLGTRISDYYGVHGSALMFSYSGENSLNLRANNNFYGSYIGSYTYNADAGYNKSYLQVYPVFIAGTYVQCTFEAGAGMKFARSGTCVVRNCNLISEGNNTGGIWGRPPSTFDRSYIVLNARSAAFYNFGGTFTNADFYRNFAGPYFNWRQLGHAKILNLINPISSLGTQGTTSATAIISRSGGGKSNILNCFFYDDSAGTYTDYTTEATNDTINDVPINGDVGDILYIKPLRQAIWTAYQSSLYFTISSQANDYTYVVEYYKKNVGWTAVPFSWDMTLNFTTTGFLYTGVEGFATTTINGVSGYWFRIRITGKGSGTPMLTRIQESTQTGAHGWHIYEKYTFDLKVQDIAGTGISGATVSMANKDGTSEFSVTTDADGLITQQTVTHLDHHFDPLTFTTQYQGIGETEYSPFTLTISKSGYQTKTMVLTMDRKRSQVVTLEKQVFPYIKTDGGLLMSLKPADNQNNLLLEL
jgi:hypothetical protein